MISLDYAKIKAYRAILQKLAEESIHVTDPLDISKGRAAEKEREFMDALLVICKQDLPALFSSSDRLLAAIAKDFRQAEEEITRSYAEK